MKVQSTGIEVTRNAVFEEEFFKFSNENAAHIFGILRGKLYSDKILAVIREYSTNAFDAHIEAGIPDTPIQITLPTLTEPYFRVRDYGSGLDPKEIYDVFVSYGASTKRETNQMVGQLGLGSKSGFAYTDMFTITSIKNGVKSIYTAYIDETGVGKVAKISSNQCDEPSGLEISIAVNSQDVKSFHNTASKFFDFFTPFPVFVNANLQPNQRKIEMVDVNGTWEIIKEPFGNCIVMGNIAYPISRDQVYNNTKFAKYTNMINSNRIIIYANIGDVQISASREALEFTDSTISYIIGRLDSMRSQIRSRIIPELMKLKYKWDIIAKANSLREGVVNMMGAETIFNGQKVHGVDITERVIKASAAPIKAICDLDKIIYYRATTYRRSGMEKIRVFGYGEEARFAPYEKDIFCVRSPHKPFIEKINTLIADDVRVICFPVEGTKKAEVINYITTCFGFDPARIIDLDEMTLPTQTKAPRTAKPTNTETIAILDDVHNKYAYSASGLVFNDQLFDLENDPAYYIVTSRDTVYHSFDTAQKALAGHGITLKNIMDIIQYSKKEGLIKDHKIVAFKYNIINATRKMKRATENAELIPFSHVLDLVHKHLLKDSDTMHYIAFDSSTNNHSLLSDNAIDSLISEIQSEDKLSSLATEFLEKMKNVAKACKRGSGRLQSLSFPINCLANSKEVSLIKKDMAEQLNKLHQMYPLWVRDGDSLHNAMVSLTHRSSSKHIVQYITAINTYNKIKGEQATCSIS